jgi:RimJ/RimL family protein N-acetyltransferase
VSKTHSAVLGYCGLFHFPDIDGQPEIEIGYRLSRSFWRQGYATEAVLAVRDYGFNVLCLPRLVALIDPQNVASIRVAEKVGTKYEKDVMMESYDHPDHLYSIIRPNWA